eukprot:g276.t1
MICVAHTTGARQSFDPNVRGEEEEGSVVFDLNRDLVPTVRAARDILPPDVVIQVPPNLIRVGRPNLLSECIAAGARDLGGISLVNVDEVNPSYEFPAVDEIRDELHRAGYALRARTCVDPKLARSLLREPMAGLCLSHEWSLREESPRQ